jgi:hypothetical protein
MLADAALVAVRTGAGTAYSFEVIDQHGTCGVSELGHWP